MAGRLPSSRQRLKAKAEAGAAGLGSRLRLEDGCCVFFPPRWEEEAGVSAPAVKTSHLEVARSPVSYMYKRRTRTSVVHVVPYVQVSTAQLGVAALLGLGLLGLQATVKHTVTTHYATRDLTVYQ